MTPLVLMLTWILQAHPVMCEVPVPMNVNISSKHFVHLLTWQPGPASPKDVYYNVSVASLNRGNSWEPVAGCEHVEDPLLCNMTGAFPDRSEVYYCKVQAVLGQQVSTEAMTEGFKPIQDTHLNPPMVSLRACGRGLCVGLRPPVAGLDDVYDSLSYALKVNCSSMETCQFSRETKSLKEVILPDLVPGREYCVEVRISDNLERRDSVYGSRECVHTTATHTTDTEAAVVLCVLVVGGVAVMILLVHTGVCCLQTSALQMLSDVKHHEKQLLTDPSSETMFSTVHVEASLPPAAETEDSSQSCEESEGEAEDGSRGKRGNYEIRPSASTMTNPLSSCSSSCSSSSISSSAQLLPCPIPGATTGQTSQSSGAPTDPVCVRHQPAVPVPDRQTEPAGTPDRPSPGAPDRPSPGTPDRPSPDRPSPGTPDRPSPGTPDRPSPDRPSPGTPDRPSPGTPDRPSPDRPSPGTPDRPSPGTPDRPSPDRPSPGTPDRPSPGTPDRPSPDRPSPGTPDRPSPGTPDRPSPDRPSPGTPDRPSPGTPDRPSPGTPDRPSPGTPDRPSPGTPDRPSPDRPSPGTPDRPSPTQTGGGPLPARPLSGTGRSPDEAQCPPPSVEVRLKPRRAAETDRGTVEAGELQEGSGLDVNLLSVRLGGRLLEEGAEPKPGVSEEGAAVSSRTSGDWYRTEEEEQEECNGYMKRSPFLYPLPLSPYPSIAHSILSPGECMLPAPLKVSILSFNLEHNLTWLPGIDVPAHAQFRVHSLHLRRNSWKPVKGCEMLRSSQTCNLTKAFRDPLRYYQARVQAFTPTQNSNWTLSSLFHPLTETVVGPPGVAVSGCGNCLLLKLTPPADRGPQLSFFYRDFTCQVQRTRDGSQFSLGVVSTKETVIDYLEPGVEYCLTAVASPVLNPHVVPSEPHCVFTSPPASSNVPMFLGVLSVFCLLGALFIGAVVYTGHMLCLAKPLPKTLVLYHQHPSRYHVFCCCFFHILFFSLSFCLFLSLPSRPSLLLVGSHTNSSSQKSTAKSQSSLQDALNGVGSSETTSRCRRPALRRKRRRMKAMDG
ncbi:cytokine receptor family member b2 [Osmerus mordax]|uniref:cytokine receptor family member b2 n=1 Tax=Osmerus mordax TaxID=8014 RepID=UPI00350F0006